MLSLYAGADRVSLHEGTGDMSEITKSPSVCHALCDFRLHWFTAEPSTDVIKKTYSSEWLMKHPPDALTMCDLIVRDIPECVCGNKYPWCRSIAIANRLTFGIPEECPYKLEHIAASYEEGQRETAP